MFREERSERGRVCAPRARRPGRKQERCSRVCVGRLYFVSVT